MTNNAGHDLNRREHHIYHKAEQRNTRTCSGQ
jgi:hypothetical protein